VARGRTFGLFCLAAVLAGFMLLAGSGPQRDRLDSHVQAELLRDHISGLIHAKSASMDLAFISFPDYTIIFIGPALRRLPVP